MVEAENLQLTQKAATAEGGSDLGLPNPNLTFWPLHYTGSLKEILSTHVTNILLSFYGYPWIN